MSGMIITPWSAVVNQPVPMTEEEKDQAFSAFAKAICHERMPWLLPLLDAANALVIASPGRFGFSLPFGGEAVFHEVREVSELLSFVPWEEQAEA